MAETTKKISINEFMEFFRQENFHDLITPDDCHEIFVNVLQFR
jgi:hypothetical protein